MFGADLSDSVDTISSEGRPPSNSRALRALGTGPLPHLDITRPEKAYVEMRLEDRTSGITKSIDAQALLLLTIEPRCQPRKAWRSMTYSEIPGRCANLRAASCKT